MGQPGSASPRAAFHRYSVGAEFLVIAADEDEARTLVGNFVDSFPSQVDGWREGDVILQDASVDEENVEVEDA